MLNTVRKAFKKSDSNVKQATPVSSQSSHHRAATHTQSLPMNPPTPVLNSPTKSVASITDQHSINEINSNNSAMPIGRYRSSTFDAGSYKSSLLTKNQLEPQQAKEMFSTKKNNNKADRLSKQMDYHLYGKLGVGSIDSLNNIENYSLGFKTNPNMNPATTPPHILPNHSGGNSKQAPTKPKTLNLNNMSLSDLTNGVRYKNNNANYFNYDNRSGSSSPEGNSNNNAPNVRNDSKRHAFSKLTK